MQKTIRVLRTMEEAEQADREYYASLSPQEKLDLVEKRIEKLVASRHGQEAVPFRPRNDE